MTDEPINCEEVIEQLFAYLDGELDGDAVAAIDRHLAHCRDCFTRAEFERRLRDRLAQSATARAPARLHHRVRRLLDEF